MHLSDTYSRFKGQFSQISPSFVPKQPLLHQGLTQHAPLPAGQAHEQRAMKCAAAAPKTTPRQPALVSKQESSEWATSLGIESDGLRVADFAGACPKHPRRILKCYYSSLMLISCSDSLQDMIPSPDLQFGHIAEIHHECRLEGHGCHKGSCKEGDSGVSASVCSPGGGAQRAVQAAQQLLQRKILLKEAMVRCPQPDLMVAGTCCITPYRTHYVSRQWKHAKPSSGLFNPANLLRWAPTQRRCSECCPALA